LIAGRLSRRANAAPFSVLSLTLVVRLPFHLTQPTTRLLTKPLSFPLCVLCVSVVNPSPSVASGLAPFMFRVFATEFLFDFGVSFLPEARQILCNLDWPMIRCQDLHDNKDAPAANAQGSFDTVQVLYTGGKDGRLTFSILKLVAAAIGELESLGCEPIQLFLLGLREPCSNDRPYRPIFYVLVAQCAVANLLDQVKTRFLIDSRQLQFWEPNGQTICTGNPLVDIVRPIHQRTAALNDLFCENFGSLLGRWRLDLCALKNEIAKNQVAPCLNPPHG